MGGVLDESQLKVAIRCLGFEPQQEDLVGLGRIDFSAFSELMTKKYLARNDKDELVQCFKLFKDDQSNKVTVANIKKICRELGETLSDEEIREMVAEADKDGDGMLSEDDFLSFMKKTNLYVF